MPTRRPRAEPGPAAVLLACSGAVAVAVAVANVAVIAAGRPTARVRDLRLPARLGVHLDALDVPLLTALPDVVHAFFPLHAWAGLAAFGALAILVHVVLAWLAVAVAAPLVIPLARRRAPAGGRWPRGLPSAMLAAALVPVVAHRLGLWTGAGTGAVTLGAAALVTAAWWSAGRWLHSESAARRLVAAARAVTAAGLAAVALGGLAAAALPARAPARAAAPPDAPNVLLVSIDTLRPDHLGCYGYARDTSPQLDALAAAGTRFATAVSPTSWTLPAHVSLLTALPPEVHGVAFDGRRLDEGVVTLTEVLRANGWATAGFVSGPYLDGAYGYARGFDLYDDYSAVRISRPAVHQARTSPTLLAIVTRWLDRWRSAEPRRPFFVFLHMWDPHYDFNPPPPYDTMFDPDYRGTVTGDDFQTGAAIHAGMDPRDLAHVVALYDGEIRYTDEYLGRVVALLRAHGTLDDTIVVVTSDHGEEFFEHGEKGHHNALYEESIRVPLVVRYPPRVAAGRVVERQVRLVDVAPTILALAGVAAPPGFGAEAALGDQAGRSLVPVLRPDGSPDALPPLPAFADLQPHALSAVRHEARKLIVGPFGTGREQLFDLRADPGERRDLAGARPGERATLRRELDGWHAAARAAAKRTGAAAVSVEHRDALRALGYIQ